MYPIDALTEKDFITIQNWIEQTQGIQIDVEDIKNKTLREWNTSKIRLFKLFGRDLRIRIPYTRILDEYTIKERLYQYVGNIPYSVFLDKVYFDRSIKKYSDQELHELTKFSFNFEMCFFIYLLGLYNKEEITYEEIKNIFYGLTRWTNNIIYNNFFNSIDDLENFDAVKNCIYFYFRDKRPLRIDLSSKFMRSIQKIVKYFEFPYMEQFNAWASEISAITTTSKYTTNLVLSIHPIDFMTASDNNSNWTSCMSWKNDGGYSSGTIEMMNSNITIIAYLENKEKPFTTFVGDIIPNKMWRVYCYIHKDILMVGNNYPNEDIQTSQFLLKVLTDLVEKKNHWTYRWMDQEYHDMFYLDNEGSNGASISERTNFERFNNKHSIILTTNAMYNDMGTHDGSNFYCNRNWVKETKFINVSGKNTCILCGKDRGKYFIAAKSKICNTCEKTKLGRG